MSDFEPFETIEDIADALILRRGLAPDDSRCKDMQDVLDQFDVHTDDVEDRLVLEHQMTDVQLKMSPSEADEMLTEDLKAKIIEKGNDALKNSDIYPGNDEDQDDLLDDEDFPD